MTVNEFLEKLKCFNPPENIDHIRNLLNQDDIDLGKLSEYVLNNHKSTYFPTRAHFYDYWQKCKDLTDKKFKKSTERSLETLSQLNLAREKWKSFTVKKILNLLLDIDKLQRRGVRLKMLETDFWAIYGRLYFEAKLCMQYNFDLESKKRHLLHVKNCLEEDNYFESIEKDIKKNKFTEAEAVPFEKTIKFENIF